MEKTTLSSKGQVILPKSVRQARNWTAGTEFSVESFDDGVLLRPLKPFPRTKLERAFGKLLQSIDPVGGLDNFETGDSLESKDNELAHRR